MALRAPTAEGPGTLDYDLIVIGSGPAGQGAALQAARLGRRAALVERQKVLGGASTNRGTVPTKILRAAIVELTGIAQGVYGRAYRASRSVSIDDLLWRAEQVIEREQIAIHDELRRCRVDVLTGTASFVDAHTVRIDSEGGSSVASAERFVVAVGTRPARPPEVEFDDRTVIDLDGILGLATIPGELTVVGASVAGIEYASLAAALGVQVTLVDRCPHILASLDDEVVEALRYHLAGFGVRFRLGEPVTSVRRTTEGALVRLRDGGIIHSEVVIYAVGRHGASRELNLAAAGLEADQRGRIAVDADYRTARNHIFAAGDVTSCSGSAAKAREQGRLAALAAFRQPIGSTPRILPYAVYSIPEISYLGATERQLREAEVPYVAGIGRFRQLTAGEIAGDRFGFLKLLVHADARQLLGVHVFGTLASELVHVGQTAMAAGVVVDYLADAVFNVPTFADAFRLAALDAVARLAALGDTP